MYRIGGEDGHAFTYNRAVGEAARSLGWEHRAAVHAGCTVRPLPPGWQQRLATIEHRRLRPGGRMAPDPGSIFRAARSLAEYVRQELAPLGRPVILFMEFFTVTDLLVLALALARVPRKNLWVCLLYRMEVQRQKTRQVYRALNMSLRRQVGRRHFTLLSDSRPLAKALTALFRQPVAVMPIPHAAAPADWQAPAWAAGRPELVAWWPGRPTADKGLASVERLCAQTGPAARRCLLVAAAAAGLTAVAGGCQVRLIANELANAEYWGWMLAADVILLPYDLSYAERTSGIFVEAITAGKLALTTAGTWMAGELLAHGLPELIMDWSSPRVWETALGLAQNAPLRGRLAAMQADYQRYHSLAGFAAALQAALTPALP
jgi:hypothetical protein